MQDVFTPVNVAPSLAQVMTDIAARLSHLEEFSDSFDKNSEVLHEGLVNGLARVASAETALSMVSSRVTALEDAYTSVEKDAFIRSLPVQASTIVDALPHGLAPLASASPAAPSLASSVMTSDMTSEPASAPLEATPPVRNPWAPAGQVE